ncbi:MAG: hypothetical protein JXA96_17210 [Sedimentisphaerales bacterium]|nr:hypothetical protein [Sedimentisphaerales bacterium]
MPTYQVKSIINGEPTFEKPLKKILSELTIGGAIKLLSPLEYITDRQRRWYKGVCLRELAKNDENGETIGWWDTEVKKECNGLALLKKEIFFIDDGSGGRIGIGRLTTKGVGKKNMILFIEEIISRSLTKGWDISPPDPDLRKF